jgi:hypothetical protein
MNQKKVPQVNIATGDSYWGFGAKKYPGRSATSRTIR